MSPFQFPTINAGVGSPSEGVQTSTPGGMPLPVPVPSQALSFGSVAPSQSPGAGTGYGGITPFTPATNVTPYPTVPVRTTPTVAPVVPDVGSGVNPVEDAGGWFKNTVLNSDGSLNMDTIGTLASTLGSFGKLYAGFQANKLAKDTLNFQKEAYQTNLANQISSYNLSLEDRMAARYAQKEGSDKERDAYVSKHKLGS